MDKKKERPRLTEFLIGLCSLIYLSELLYGYFLGEEAIGLFLSTYGLSFNSFFAGNYWNIITSMFLHASPEHLILNMIALYFFGRAIELELGWRRMLVIFVFSGIIGNLFVLGAGAIGFMPVDIPTIGASAAVFGLMGAAMFVKPFDLIFYPYLIPVPLILVAILYTLYNLIAFIAVLLTGVDNDIAFIAHLGGLITGIYFGMKVEGVKKDLMVILLIILILLAIPVLLSFLQYLEFFNYSSVLSWIFGIFK